MKRTLYFLIFFYQMANTYGQESGSFTIGGSIDRFYPVTFLDGGYVNNVPTELTIGRSSVHENASWRGSLMAKFIFHTTNWGNNAAFMDATIQNDLNPGNTTMQKFVAGWRDGSLSNGSRLMIIWLKGGTTTYHYKANYAVTPTVYDSVQNALPLTLQNMPAFYSKTQIDSYVNTVGRTWGSNQNFLGNVGIGIATPQEKLSVNGDIRAKQIKVEAANWPDYVFDSSYYLPSLSDLEHFIKNNRHLPDIPSAKEVKEQGIEIGSNQAALLRKIEEQALYIIEQNKRLQTLEKRLDGFELLLQTKK